MRSPTYALIVASALLSTATPAFGATTIVVSLTNAQEVLPMATAPGGVFPTTSTGTPPVSTGIPRPTSFGTATLQLNDAMTALTYAITVFNIDFTGTQTADPFDNLTAAHIHAGANPTALTQPVVFGFIGQPFNDNNPNDVVVSPFVNGVGGTVSGKWDAVEGQNTTLTAQLANLLGGRAYLNFHTVQFPGGEVRGNIPSVPEPSTWAMMLLGFGFLGAAMRRRPKLRQRVQFAL